MTELKSELRRALEDWNIVAAEALINNQDSELQIANESMELVGMVCEYLTPQVEEAGPHFARCCQDILLVLANKGNAKENLISLLEHLEAFRTLRLVRRLLPALSVTLLNIKDKSKSHAWSWALDTLACHLKTIQHPENKGLEGAERLTLDLDPNISEIIEFLDDMPPLLEPLVDHCTTCCEDRGGKENRLRKSYLFKFLLQCFGHLVASLNQHPETGRQQQGGGQQLQDGGKQLQGGGQQQQGDGKHLQGGGKQLQGGGKKLQGGGKPLQGSGQQLQGGGQQQLFPRSHASSSRLVMFVSRLISDMFGEVVSIPGKLTEKEKEDFGCLDTSIGVYLYLIYGEDMCIGQVLSVYSHMHLLRSSSRYIVHMITSTVEAINLKGLLLLNSLLNRTPFSWLTDDASSDPEMIALIDPISKVVVHHNLAEHRALGFRCYQRFVGLFDARSRFDLYRRLFNSLNHSGLLGWTVTHFKNTLEAAFAAQPQNQLLHKTYSGARLTAVFKKLFSLRHGAKTDLLEISDELIAEINLAYFVVSRNPASLQEVDLNLWVEQIREGLQMSRAHWQLELNNLDQPTASSKQQPEMTVTVGAMPLPEMDPKQKREVIRSALTTLDVIQFNLVSLSSKLE